MSGHEFEDDEPDFEVVEEMHVEMREHMFASDLLAVATTEEAERVLAHHFALIRGMVDLLADFAMVLGRLPTPEMATMIADKLREVSESLEANLPVKADEEEAA